MSQNTSIKYYRVSFKDYRGCEEIQMQDDGTTLCIELRGVVFRAHRTKGFQYFEVTEVFDETSLNQFLFWEQWSMGERYRYLIGSWHIDIPHGEVQPPGIVTEKDRDDVRRKLNLLDSRLPFSVQGKTLQYFDGLSDSVIGDMLYKNCKNDAVAYVLTYLGYERLKDFTIELLEYLQDVNWGTSWAIRQIFEGRGHDIAPIVKSVFQTDWYDSTWIYNLLRALVIDWKAEDTAIVLPELLDIIKNTRSADDEDAAKAAWAVVVKHKLLPAELFNEYYQFMFKRYGEGMNEYTDI